MLMTSFVIQINLGARVFSILIADIKWKVLIRMTIGRNTPHAYDLAYSHRREVAEYVLSHEAPRKDAKYPISIIYNSYHDVP